jgi:hypothetical protein
MVRQTHHSAGRNSKLKHNDTHSEFMLIMVRAITNH